jgi:hypothetical protein
MLRIEHHPCSPNFISVVCGDAKPQCSTSYFTGERLPKNFCQPA